MSFTLHQWNLQIAGEKNYPLNGEVAEWINEEKNGASIYVNRRPEGLLRKKVMYE